MQAIKKLKIREKTRALLNSRPRTALFFVLIFASIGVLTLLFSAADTPTGTIIRQQNFSADPNWEGVRNQLTGPACQTVTQDFGYVPGQQPGYSRPGAVGGQTQSSSSVSYYGKVIQPKTFNDAQTAEGVFTSPVYAQRSGIQFGWFNSKSFDYHKPNSMVFKISEGPNRQMVLNAGVTSQSKLAQNDALSSSSPDTLLLNPGQVYHWTLTYTPTGGPTGNGQLAMHIDGLGDITAGLSAVQKQDGANFDRFGVTTSDGVGVGGKLTTLWGDLKLNGQPIALATQPADWEGVNNHSSYQDCLPLATNKFGWNESNGDIGGVVRRLDGSPAWYADRLLEGDKELSLSVPLEADGTIRETHSSSDDGVKIGWFNVSGDNASGCLCFSIGGLSRMGDSMQPFYAGGKGNARFPIEAQPVPFLTNNNVARHWHLSYVPLAAPAADGTMGTLTLTVDGLAMALPIKAGVWDENLKFNRFGIQSTPVGGGSIQMYLDNLSYSAGLADNAPPATIPPPTPPPAQTPGTGTTTPGRSGSGGNLDEQDGITLSGPVGYDERDGIPIAGEDYFNDFYSSNDDSGGQSGSTSTSTSKPSFSIKAITVAHIGSSSDPVQSSAKKIGLKPPSKKSEQGALIAVFVLLLSSAFFIFHDSSHVQRGGMGFNDHEHYPGPGVSDD